MPNKDLVNDCVDWKSFEFNITELSKLFESQTYFTHWSDLATFWEKTSQKEKAKRIRRVIKPKNELVLRTMYTVLCQFSERGEELPGDPTFLTNLRKLIEFKNMTWEPASPELHSNTKHQDHNRALQDPDQDTGNRDPSGHLKKKFLARCHERIVEFITQAIERGLEELDNQQPRTPSPQCSSPRSHQVQSNEEPRHDLPEPVVGAYWVDGSFSSSEGHTPEFYQNLAMYSNPELFNSNFVAQPIQHWAPQLLYTGVEPFHSALSLPTMDEDSNGNA